MQNRLSRRQFSGSLAAFFAALGWEGCVDTSCAGARLAPWRPGNLDLHFIYTGCGENMFYRLPDGTAILNDTGDFYRPKDVAEVPLLPSSARLGGDWVSRYLQRIYPEKTIDYAIFSHWHSDHIGHASFDVPDTPAHAFRWRATPDGRKIDGFLCVAEDFRFRRCLVHDQALANAYGTADTSLPLLRDWLAAERPCGLVFEPFRVGALDQIRLQRDAAAWRGRFSVRNLCANGVLWDGRDGTDDFAAEHVRVTKRARFDQNMLSLGFVMQYGAFRYFAGGDFQNNRIRRADGRVEQIDAQLGRLVGPVTVAKMLHHGCSNAMTQGYADAVRADVHVGCMWCPRQSAPDAMDRIVRAGSARRDRPLILPQILCADHRRWAAEKGWDFGYAQAVHVVVRVAPGGSAYTVYLLDAADEEMRIVASFPGQS